MDYYLKFIIRHHSKILQIQASFQEDLESEEAYEQFEKISTHYKNVATAMFAKDDINSDKIVDRSEFKWLHTEL